jgi:hypothetical protein
MYSFRAEKVMVLSDRKYGDHILPFLESGGFPHVIVLTDAEIMALDGHRFLFPFIPLGIVTFAEYGIP